MTDEASEDIWRRETPHVLAALVRRYGDLARCEDAVQEALLVAADEWPDTGVPDKPRGWLLRVASRRFIDMLRQDTSRRDREERSARLDSLDRTAGVAGLPDAVEDEDSTLEVLTLCCHPALSVEAQVTLALRAVLGLTTQQIAEVYVIPASTAGQRISRAKATIDRNYREFPTPESTADRVQSLMHALYLMFTAGYGRSTGEGLLDQELTGEAIRLARLLDDYVPDDPETAGLLALMLLSDARRPARISAEGELVPLKQQDRTLWDRAKIDEGVELVETALPSGPVGPYQLQAAIAAVHCESPDWPSTDWEQIVMLYEMLVRVAPSPVVTMNLAVAVNEVRGPEAALSLVEPLLDDQRLGRSHRLHAVRAHLLEECGRREEALESYRTAGSLCTSIPEQRHINREIGRLQDFWQGGAMTPQHSPGSSAADSPEVSIETGRVRGIWRGESAAFLGIPYAEPPVGDLRFSAPVPHGSWDGVRDATTHGATPQRRLFSTSPTIPEAVVDGDSRLNVNVFTPAPGDDTAKLPVFVWLHGGAFLEGSPSSPWYDGRSFNRDGIVTVNVAYRLGVDGFGAVGEDDRTGRVNRGLLDQVAALEWVQRNIAQFGGDPDQVTIGGQSAGGTSVLDLLAVPATEGLFHRAIAQSPAVNDIPVEEVDKYSERLADTLGIEHTLEGWRSLPEEKICDVESDGDAYGGTSPFGRPEPVDIVPTIRAVRGGHPGVVSMKWAPAVDGKIFTASVAEAVAGGQAAQVPLLLGRARNETPVPSPRPRSEVESQLQDAGVPDAAIERLGAELEIIGDQFADAQVMGELLFGVGTLRVAEARRTAAGQVPDHAGTWLYDFAGRVETGKVSPHCTDIPYSFDVLDADRVPPASGPTQPLADAMHGDWVRFIKGEDPEWPSVQDAGIHQARVYDADGSHIDPGAYDLTAGLAGLQ
ncbi:MAG TPA: sigma-70 family RNA polymerase sigma factor [Candidatus Corynebacterium avicola]|uniref:Sigma-70 family RNA polymerase sigma factor n=1 Tax=Candidatus Corynebacterium avicola TaxID=2838527 RepID=A0A9D1UL84_9CORY|nr:sigma-70 family RNA polymerase sigma factor [Candidatus Corynebacterium avicola]